jgi:DNA-binding NarL/FixJ family response regulator
MKIKLLMIEDSPFLRKRLVTMLSEIEEVEIVGQAESGEEGLELLERFEPKIVLLDLLMPGRNGLETLIEIRKRNLWCVVIVLSNYNSREIREACLRAGANFFFNKSREFEQAAEIVKSIASLVKLPEVSADALREL